MGAGLGADDGERHLRPRRRDPLRQREYHQYIATARARLDEQAYTAARAEGQAMSLETAIAYALESCAAPPSPGAPADPWEPAVTAGPRPMSQPPSSTAEPPAASGMAAPTLSPREREVAALVARDLSNREIAARLVIAERTAETHVANIMHKLGCRSRAAIATWATERGLRVDGTDETGETGPTAADGSDLRTAVTGPTT